MTFATLALIVALGVIGPLLALPKRLHLPVILGELLAGIIFGTTGLQIGRVDVRWCIRRKPSRRKSLIAPASPASSDA